MTEEKIKEALSNNYIGVIAARNGFFLVKGEHDSGIDFSVKYHITRIQPSGKTRETEAPYSCNLQLKATTEKSIKIKKGHIIYDLRVENYNDLIYHKSLGNTPLVLILFVLPFDKLKWVEIFDDKLYLSKNAFWYYPDKDDEVKNSSTVRIKIPIENKVNFDFFNERIKTWIPEWKLID
ncbi:MULTISPECIES: DUF4365 domain-containing protein [Flavobacteriaceae]|uniref:DUF4365 domain-containing protein n=1 Tax=Flavobacteriaceae TaxID=49546 RepID=UPI00234A78DE|nr:DUF4365 domain-containing protein [Muricauda sp. SP22]MDC6362995.1 DUF4365 domain-containing protein [Muricauda sp. SP22]